MATLIDKSNSSFVLKDAILIKEIDAYIRDNYEYLWDLIVKISSIPSPTGNEGKKADFILDTVKGITGGNVWKDEVGNVLYHLKGGGGEALCLVTAHIDTVFKDLDRICPERLGNKVYAPSIWDNSVNVAGLIFCIKMFCDLNIPIQNDMLLAFTVGEEGLGNLKGIRHIMEYWKDKIHEVVALDTGYNAVLNRAVGSRRYSVTVEAEGGHSWASFGRPNAIVYASRIINALYSIELPSHPKTTYNVGLIKGGTSVNTIAQYVEMVLDFRSIEEKTLIDLEQTFFDLLEGFKTDEVTITAKLLGERPCGRDVDTSGLTDRLAHIRQHFGLGMNLRVGSTDANIPLSLGIPAITFGVCNGGRSHTLEEYIELDSLEIGIRHLAYFLSSS